MSKAAFSSAPPPRASWSAMPVELKLKVVQFAKLQDEAFERMGKDKASSLDWSVVEKFVGRNRWYGKSLAALLETDRELHGLVAPLLFDTVSFKSMLQPIFGSHISPTFQKFFKRLKLRSFSMDGDTVPNSTATSSLALSLTMTLARFFSFSHIEIDGDFVEALLPTNPDDHAALLSDTFRALSTTVRQLRVANIEPSLFYELVPLFQAVTSVEFISEDDISTLALEDYEDFLPTLSRLTSLTNLIFTATFGGGHFFSPPLPPFLNQIPALRFLRIDATEIDDNDWQFIGGFTSLERLEIDVFGFSFKNPQYGGLDKVPPFTTLSKLRHLSIVAPYDIIFEHFLSSFQNVPLTHLDISIRRTRQDDAWIITPPVDHETILDPFLPTLKNLHFTFTSIPYTQEEDIGRAVMLAGFRDKMKNVTCEVTLPIYSKWDQFGPRRGTSDEPLVQGSKYLALIDASDFIGRLVLDWKNLDATELDKVLAALEGVRAFSLLKRL